MRISLIVPVYNLADCLDETASGIAVARAALGRDAGETEILFVDDGSTDGSGARLDALSGRDGVRVIHRPNGGPGAARNAGMEDARGDYVFYLDGDDVLLPNALTEAFGLLRAHPHADIVSFRFEPFASGGEVPAPAESRTVRELDVRAEIPSELIVRLGIFPTLFSRKLLSGVRFRDLPLGEDRLFALQCLARADAVVVSDAVVEGYRVREGSLARAPWSVRKIRSLNDHAVGGLAALVRSGKAIGREGAGYLASLVVSEVPARILRLGRSPEADGLWAHWIASVGSLPAERLPASVRLMRRTVLALSFSRGLSLAGARALRRLGVA